MSEEVKPMLSLDDAKSDIKSYIAPGIHEVIIVAKEEPGEDVTGNREFKSLRFVTLDGENDLAIRFYNSAAKDGKKAAVTMSCQQLNHILSNSIPKAEYDELKKQCVFEDSHDGWVQMHSWIMDHLVGKSLRMKFIGEEKAGGKYITRLGFPPFAESLTVPANLSKLQFSKSNPKDWRPLPPDLLSQMNDVPTSPVGTVPESPNNSLPF